jgi:hypothetical protein
VNPRLFWLDARAALVASVAPSERVCIVQAECFEDQPRELRDTFPDAQMRVAVAE